MARKAQPTKDDPKVEAAAGAEAETPEAPTEATQAAAEEQAKATEADAQQPDEEGADNPADDAGSDGDATEEGAAADDEGDDTPKDVHQPATRARMVDATLKARHCRGGVCKEKGETMRMTAGEYERLKKHGRVE